MLTIHQNNNNQVSLNFNCSILKSPHNLLKQFFTYYNHYTLHTAVFWLLAANTTKRPKKLAPVPN